MAEPRIPRKTVTRHAGRNVPKAGVLIMSAANPGFPLYREYLISNARRRKAGKMRQSWVQWCISAAKPNYGPVIAWYAKHGAR